MLVMNTNFFLKHMATVASQFAGDTQKFNNSNCYLDTAFVNQYAWEVQKHLETKKSSATVDPEDSNKDNNRKDSISKKVILQMAHHPWCSGNVETIGKL